MPRSLSCRMAVAGHAPSSIQLKTSVTSTRVRLRVRPVSVALSLAAACAFVSVVSDQCYYALDKDIFQFNGGAAIPAKWKSREIVHPTPVNYGACQVVASGPWTIKFYADGKLRYTKSVNSGTTFFRLPGGFKATRWMFEITGSGVFSEMRIAQTGAGLAQL